MHITQTGLFQAQSNRRQFPGTRWRLLSLLVANCILYYCLYGKDAIGSYPDGGRKQGENRERAATQTENGFAAQMACFSFGDNTLFLKEELEVSWAAHFQTCP